MLGDLRKNYELREKKRADAGDRPDYSGPKMGLDKFRYKEQEARDKREERARQHEEQQEQFREQKARRAKEVQEAREKTRRDDEYHMAQMFGEGIMKRAIKRMQNNYLLGIWCKMIENFNYDKEHPPSFGEKVIDSLLDSALVNSIVSLVKKPEAKRRANVEWKVNLKGERVLVTVEESRGFFESLFQSNDDEDEEANMDLQVEESADDVQADSGDAIRALCMDQPLKTAEQRRAEMKAKLSNSDDTRQVQRKNDNMTQEERQLLGDSK